MRFSTRSAQSVRKNHTVTPLTNLSGGTVPNPRLAFNKTAVLRYRFFVELSASRRYRGRRPFWGQAILRKYVRPVAQWLGIQKCIGWHTFSSRIFDAAEKRGYRVQSYAGTVAAFNSAIHVGCLHPGNHAGQTCSSGSFLSLVFSCETNGTSQLSGSNDVAA
jgi:hypothetical protein